ncbi:MAG: type II toxin-antitoxin system VapC family toxin [Parachlamydiaceae bacterium]
MRLLIDTHVFLWCVNNDRKLTKKARSKILDADEVYVSAASIWEATIKIRLKKLDADVDALVEAITKSGFLELPITARHASAVNRLKDIHRDPFDRILIAQATVEPLIFLTADNGLANYSNIIEVI